ncbi:MAG TPA: phosphoribosylglycinamide formyltransferase [Bacteroidales bacterium]|nr:phosphoribosylglycinamide formyltransferase [Bacteroidales bacterium]
MDRIAIFASGSGTNAEQIISYFNGHASVEVGLVLSNKPDAYVLERAKNHAIPSFVFNRHEFYETTVVPDLLQEKGITFVVLAGFLWMVPESLLVMYPGKILNIHPALLPLHGGKGMYGMKVHEAVIASGADESGITIHKVNDRYDAGSIVFQAKCPVLPDDTPETLAMRIHQLEYRYFPEMIEKVIMYGA